MSLQRFQVDLGGLIDLLSEHLYSGPHVFVRELLQNAVDAVTARSAVDPDAPATIRLWCAEIDGAPAIAIQDTGIGLTAAEASELLATIGSSSKRQAGLGGRAEFIGQFGIGMLACFMVADRVEVTSRSATGEHGVRWIGHSNGEFELTQLADELPIGTLVLLRAKPGAEHWFSESTLVALASDYGALLPFDVAVRVQVEGAGPLWRRINGPAPWLQAHPSEATRRAALTRYCETTFGFTPLTSIDLDLPLAGLSGVAYVLPQAVAPAAGQHRVYLKGMLLGARVGGILPDWAFFVRAVVATDTLAPAASREQLRHDDVLLATQEALGGHLKTWASSTLRGESHPAREFVRIHHLALRALALTDDAMLDLVSDVLPFETTDGQRTLREISAASGEVVFAATTEAYRRVATVARAQGLTVLNAGYVYDSDIMERLGRRRGWNVRELTTSDLTQVLRLLTPERESQTAAALMVVREILAGEDCDVIIRRFEPESVPALLLRDADGDRRRELAREREAAPDRWGGLLESFGSAVAGRSRTLVLNDASDNVRQVLRATDPDVVAAAVYAFYLSAVMLAGEGLRASERAALNSSLATLLDAALRPFPMTEEKPHD